ncbi:MAG TPA: hypothetical protein VFD43_07285 [Planctomycetota bacterium]|nr:hypothetical protein [Planctomycetota bacterium]
MNPASAVGESSASRAPAWTQALVIGLLVLAAALRLPGLFMDFWLDEVWSHYLVRDLTSPIEVATSVHSATNHWLTAAWIQVLGPGQPIWIYRLPSFLAGLACVLAAGALARALASRSTATCASLCAMALAATNFSLINYSTEARGYSLLALSGLGASLCLLRYEQQQGPWRRAGYWLCMSAALMAHLMATQFLLSCVVYSLCVRGIRPAGLVKVATTHGPPLAFLVLVVAIDVAHFQKLVPPPTDIRSGTAELAAMCLGLPARGWGAVPGVLLTAALLALLTAQGLRGLGAGSPARADRSWWLLPALNLAVIPVLLIVGLRLPAFFARYCIAGVALFQVALAVWLAAQLGAGGRKAVLAVALLVVVTAANARQWAAFQADGRGHYEAALEAILQDSGDAPITVASDDDFQILMVVNFHREYLPELHARMTYRQRAADEQQRADWRIVHSHDVTAQPSERLTLEDGTRYVLRGTYPSSWISGMPWFVYRREG